MVKHVIFDLDQTLIDTSIAASDRYRRDWEQAYLKIPSMAVYEGIYDLLNFLQNKEITFSVLTTSPSIYCGKVLRHFNIKPNCIIAYHDVTYRKPNPEGINKIIISMGVLAKDVIHIGDQENDVYASKRAGVISVGAMWGNTNNTNLIESRPDFVISKPIEILNLISSINDKN